MPVHDFQCPAGHVTEQMVGQGVEAIPCPKCQACTPECLEKHIPGYDVLHVGYWAKKVFLKAPAGFVQKDICYDSPIDGRAVTSKHARLNDLARAECIPYEPGMKQDAERSRQDAEARLDKAMDETMDAALEVMDARKKEKLVSEISSGADVNVERGTPTLH